MTRRIESTCPKTAGVQPDNTKFAGAGSPRRPYPWIRFRQSREVDALKVYVFTDGSSLGGFGAVVVAPGKAPLELSGFVPATKTRNVGAELNGALLGLSHAPVSSQVVLICDYLGVAAWLCDLWSIKDDGTRAQVAAIEQVIRERQLDVAFVHHRGHQKDSPGDDFTKFNRLADSLADDANEANGIVVAKRRKKLR